MHRIVLKLSIQSFINHMSLSTIKWSICIILTTLSISTASVFWYFEDRLLCDIRDNQVQVSIDTQADGGMNTYCFTVLQRLAKKIVPLEADLLRATTYATQWSEDDRRYWNQVVMTLENSLSPYRTLRNLVTSSMNDYEHELFFSIKNLVKTYLRGEYDILNQRLDQAYILKKRIVSLWNSQQFEFIQDKIQERETQRMVLLTIRNATSFDTLIPALSNYFGLQEYSEETI